MSFVSKNTEKDEMRKKVFYTELAYVLGLIIMAFSAAFMEKADFGMSMIVAPAYIIHLKVVESLPWFSFGVAEYCFQGALILLTVIIMRRFKVTYLFSFVTALLYGTLLDAAMLVISPLAEAGLALRILYYVFGMLLCSFAVSLFFHTYLSPEAYELIVKELGGKYGRLHKIKIGYDLLSLVVSVALSFVFFGFGVFKGISWGTLVCALANGFCIGGFTKLLESRFIFKNKFAIAKYFE